MPNKILLITKKDLLNYINKFINIDSIKLNNKNGTGDNHGSAFLPINMLELTKKTKCYFDTLENFKKINSDEFLNYLNNKEKPLRKFNPFIRKI